MLYSNIKALEHNSQMGINELDMNIPSPYDTDRQEIEALMLRFLPPTSGPSTRSILSARTYGAVVEKHLLVGSEQALFLRDHAEHG